MRKCAECEGSTVTHAPLSYALDTLHLVILNSTFISLQRARALHSVTTINVAVKIVSRCERIRSDRMSCIVSRHASLATTHKIYV